MLESGQKVMRDCELTTAHVPRKLGNKIILKKIKKNMRTGIVLPTGYSSELYFSCSGRALIQLILVKLKYIERVQISTDIRP